jgi:hypothetical protein
VQTPVAGAEAKQGGFVTFTAAHAEGAGAGSGSGSGSDSSEARPATKVGEKRSWHVAELEYSSQKAKEARLS